MTTLLLLSPVLLAIALVAWADMDNEGTENLTQWKDDER